MYSAHYGLVCIYLCPVHNVPSLIKKELVLMICLGLIL